MRRTLFIALIVLSLLPARPARAEEPFEEFLEALREPAITNRAKWGGQLELALKYLDRIATNPSISAAVREQVGFRRAMTYVAMARSTTNPTLRQRHLDAAEQAFEDFVREHPSHAFSGTARGQLGNVVVERARSLMKQAVAGGPNAEAVKREASQIFSKAEALLEQSRTDLAQQLEGLKAVREEAAVRQRNKLRSEYVSVKLARARVLFEHADALEGDENKYHAKLTEAAAEFDDIAQKYRKVSAGVYAILYEGQCYQRLGEDKRALSYFKELLQLPGKSPGIRKLKTKALTLSIASWLTEADNGYDIAINAATQWLTTTQGKEGDDPNWLELKLALARAYQRKSIAEDNKKQAERALSEARQLAKEVATRRGAHQREAQELLVALGRGEEKEPSGGEPAAAEDFATALAAAKQALDAMKVAGTAVKIMSSQLEKISDAGQRQEIETRLAESRERERELAAKTLELFEQADKLATEDNLNDWNTVRYYMAYLYYAQQEYRRAAVLADFVASRYPESVAARECANVALAAHQELYSQLPEQDREQQSARIGRMAEVMIANWPGQSQANNALSTLLNVTVQQGDLEKAEEYLSQIPADSPSRASAELRTGQAVWREYLKGVMARQAGEETFETSQLDEMKLRAGKILAQGIARLGQAQPDEAVIRSALSLAQIYVESGEAANAIELLKHPRYGPLTLVEQGSDWIPRIPGIAVETYKIAIRAYVASAGDSTTESSLDEAQRILDRLRRQLADQPNGQQMMIQIYVGLARDLERQLMVAAPEAKRALSRGFESFVRGAGQASDDVTVLNWVAETLFSMGKGFQEAGKDNTESRRYFGEAASTYARVLKLTPSQRDQVSDNMLTQVRTRRAIALRAIGDYQQAVDLFATVLSAQPAIVNIQAEAAKTLQAWGDAGQSDAYLNAVGGDRPQASGKNAIWGWGRLAAVVGRPELMSRNAAYRDAFYEARYNIALCHYKYAMRTPTEKQAFLKRARQDVLVTKKLYKLDAASRTLQFEALLKEIQTRLGEPAIGFAQRSAKS